ncbi:hypothetical protein E1B28_003149 [Marasmius oreades]|uniref:DUF4470 domain-containing protein n=1 Tax=Marasmius oreades TaxID=181124 RepID=A0A9P7RLZ9_9AGAR|nr:uncharacterized protein E1B28_003149 [Marasmius oreades]KAG7085598.1 hypothetical protein E1B28_003149 [Marasmius oreades]
MFLTLLRHHQYCSDRCQKQHWLRHSSTCAHPYLEKKWQPSWLAENREPRFLASSLSWSHSATSSGSHIFPALDVLQLSYNEGPKAAEMNFKLCFTACSDIRNLVKTVNSLPKDYTGRCEILMNDTDATVINRNLVVLFALLGAGPSLDEAAELATHLMYSTILTPRGAAYLQRCIEYIYASDTSPQEQTMSFRVRLSTRGSCSTIYSTQTTTGVRQPMEMLYGQSLFTFSAAMKSMRCTIMQHDNADRWDWFLSKLTPAHRMSFKNYRDSGILSPFSLNTTNFTQPNRLLFSAQDEWLGDFNPLGGWDISSVVSSGEKHGVSSADIFGCLFFHVKSQLREFARRVKDHKIEIHLTQFDPKILSKGLLAGALGSGYEGGGCFDRIDTGNMMERENIGIRECLTEWGPLLNCSNPNSVILMSTRTWHEGWMTMARVDPRVALGSIMERCFRLRGVHPRFKESFSQGLRSPKVLRMIESLDAFYDHDDALHEFLEEQKMDMVLESCGLELRSQHRVHPKRFGVPLSALDHQLPCLDRAEFYQLATLCGANFSARFLEFAPIHHESV